MVKLFKHKSWEDDVYLRSGLNTVDYVGGGRILFATQTIGNLMGARPDVLEQGPKTTALTSKYDIKFDRLYRVVSYLIGRRNRGKDV